MGKLYVVAATFAVAGLLFSAAGCDDKGKADKKADTSAAAKDEGKAKDQAVDKDKDKDKGETKPAKAGGDEITMLEHLKAANEVMCKVSLAKKMKKSEKECTEANNKLSEANKNNEKVKVSKANSDKCLEHLKAYKGDDIMGESIKGPCAQDKLKP